MRVNQREFMLVFRGTANRDRLDDTVHVLLTGPLCMSGEPYPPSFHRTACGQVHAPWCGNVTNQIDEYLWPLASSLYPYKVIEYYTGPICDECEPALTMIAMRGNS